jgi:capsular exopolysaccharide synthesis family protein
MKEAGISAGLKSSNIRIVDNSEVPTLPDQPKKSVNILLGAAIGLILGVALAFFLEYMDNSVKTPEDIDRFIRVPSLGVIPSLASIYDRKRLYGYGYGHRSESHKQRQDQNGTPEVSMIAHTNSDSIISEAYRSLRTSILLSNSGKPPKTILVTSAHKAEGKTVSSVNIAISLAQLGGRVLLLDCDMRNPNCHKALKMKNEQGMSSFLAANVDISSLIVETKVPNLFVVTAGKIPPNPAELLASPRMKQALTLVDEFFDYVVVDSPPMLAVTDALILSTIVDGVVLVVKAEATPKDVLQKARKSLQGVNAKVLGVLINQADVRGADYNYYYKYYYAYGYGADKDGRNDAA